MGLKETLEIIQNLGGQADIKEIKQVLRTNFPEYSYAEYVNRDLRRLRSYGKIEYNERTKKWYLT